MTNLARVTLAPPYRFGQAGDVPALVDFTEFASSGMAIVAWQQAVGPDQDARAFGMELLRGGGTMSYRNAVVADFGQGAVAALITHALPPEPAPLASGPPTLTSPWQELRNLACGAWHIAVLAAYPEYRGQGLGTALLGVAEMQRQARFAPMLSLLVADSNIEARRLYRRFGFREEGARPMASGAWTNPGKEWLLLIRPA